MREDCKFNVQIHKGKIFVSSVTKDPGVSNILLFSGSGINFPRPLYICTVHTRPSLPILKNTVIARLLTCLHLHILLNSKRSEFSVLKNFDIKANRTISPTSPMWSFRFGKPLSSCCASTISSVHCRLSKGWRLANKFSRSQIRNFVDLNLFRFVDLWQMWQFADLQFVDHCSEHQQRIYY